VVSDVGTDNESPERGQDDFRLHRLLSPSERNRQTWLEHSLHQGRFVGKLLERQVLAVRPRRRESGVAEQLASSVERVLSHLVSYRVVPLGEADLGPQRAGGCEQSALLPPAYRGQVRLIERLRALPVEYRAAVVLRDIEGLSNEEVARVLEISLAAAKSRIHRSRMQLRAELERWDRLRPSR